jgi:AraC-like DNA-binding protein
MEMPLDSMDNFSKHITPFPRRFPHPFPVAGIGHTRAKRDWVNQAFPTMNFSFILHGTGRYHTADRTWPVQAPCVIIQWPGVHVEYGPDDAWRELYLIYDAAHLAPLSRADLAQSDRPVWYVRDAEAIHRRVDELAELLTRVEEWGVADEIDRQCEMIILTSLLSRTRPEADPRDQAIRNARARINAHPSRQVDMDELARKADLSPATFRRHWMRIVGMPPGRYLTEIRIRSACRLLAETPLPVGQIAYRVGYEDALYFSRRFREIMGQTATAYRRIHQVPPPSRP